MYQLVQQLVREQISNVITFILAAVLIGYAFYNGTKAVDAYLSENENRHKQSSALIHELAHKVEDMEMEIEDLEDDITDLMKTKHNDDQAVDADDEISFSAE